MLISDQWVIIRMHRNLLFIVFFFFASLLATEPAFALGGLAKANTVLVAVVTVLRGCSISIGTIAIIFTGYKLMYQHAQLKDCSHVLVGGTIISGASELAIYLLS